ncbi:MAG: hypothetical protein V2A58_12525, partial [Planctomycetota bacterium]
GCGAWNPFVQSEKSRETSEKLGVTHESALAKEEAPAFAPSAGQGSTQITALGDKALKEMRRTVESREGREIERNRSWSAASSQTLTIIGVAVGIGLLALVLPWAVKRLKLEQAAAAAKAAVEPLVARIKDLVARKQETTNQETLNQLNAEISKLNSEKADVEKALRSA